MLDALEIIGELLSTGVEAAAELSDLPDKSEIRSIVGTFFAGVMLIAGVVCALCVGISMIFNGFS